MGKIFVPLSKADWTNPGTVYAYDAAKEFGVWRGSKGFTVYAPEDGELKADSEAGWILTAKNGGIREWVSTSVIEGLRGRFPTGGVVKAGEPLGKLQEDLRLAIGLTASTGSASPTWTDPVRFLQDPEVNAGFVDFTPAPQAGVGPGGEIVPVGPGGAIVPARQLLSVSSGTAFWGGLVLGGVVVLLVASAVK